MCDDDEMALVTSAYLHQCTDNAQDGRVTPRVAIHTGLFERNLATSTSYSFLQRRICECSATVEHNCLKLGMCSKDLAQLVWISATEHRHNTCCRLSGQIEHCDVITACQLQRTTIVEHD